MSLFSRIFGRPGESWEKVENWQDRAIREELRLLRARLRRGPHGTLDSASFKSRDRFARAQARKALKDIRKALAEKRPKPLQKHLLAARYRPSPILDRLIPGRRAGWRSIVRRPERKAPLSVNLNDFSFLSNPDHALASIKAIGELEMRELRANIHFDDEYCLDAGAYLVLAEVWPTMARIFSGGRMSQPIQKVLSATGVGRHNKMKLQAADKSLREEGKHSDVWAFPLQRRRPALTSTSNTVHLDPQTREEAADRFCSAVNEWLGVDEIDQELTDVGKGWIAQIIGELLCNAERHSRGNSDDGDWSTTAFMVRRAENGSAALRCYMAFLSVGRSFAESLVDAAPDVRDALEAYVRKHWASGISAHTLSTVFALQDTITCDPAARESRSGGTGLQDVLEFVDMLGGTAAEGKEPRVTIVSGNSCIKLKPPYMRGRRNGASDQPRLLWCNMTNSSDDPPDSETVYDLSEHFAGTLVSVAFTLDPDYLAQQVESGNDKND
jgi:hypothetical protein